MLPERRKEKGERREEKEGFSTGEYTVLNTSHFLTFLASAAGVMV
jgi:hypothetical protein